MKYLSGVLLAVSFLTGCGSSSSDDGGQETSQPDAVERNVALASNGAMVSATYDSDSAIYVNDADTTSSYFWSANITGDSMTIDFGSVVALSKLSVYTNDLSFSSSMPSKILEISEDQQTWLRTGDVVGGDVPCLSYRAGGDSFDCEFAAPENVRYLRITITDQNNPSLIKIFEVEATGI